MITAAAARTLAVPALASGTVHVWTVPIAAHPAAATLALLSPAERAHAARRRADGARWAAARAALRALLGAALDRAPAQVRFENTPAGRPRLAAAHERALGFSTARSGAWALIALCERADVGVDLERVRVDVDPDAIVATVFPAAERARWERSARTRAEFFASWVRLEALAKAAGCGLSHADAPGALAHVTARPLSAPPGHVAAVAAPGDGWDVSLHAWA